MLAATNFENPLFWAVLIGWIFSVVLHEFAHGIVAYWGGDYTIRQRGGLTLNPLQYIDPVTSIALPILFMVMGGIPLPGGSTYIRRDLLRSRAWSVAVSAAGPATNFLLFWGLGLLLQPRWNWVDADVPVGQWTMAQKFVAATAFFQLLSAVLNLLPIPPLDGFQMISPFLPPELRGKVATFGWIPMMVLFALMWSGPASGWMRQAMADICNVLGIDFFNLSSAAAAAMN